MKTTFDNINFMTAIDRYLKQERKIAVQDLKERMNNENLHSKIIRYLLIIKLKKQIRSD